MRKRRNDPHKTNHVHVEKVSGHRHRAERIPGSSPGRRHGAAGDQKPQLNSLPAIPPLGPDGVWPSEPPADCPFKPSPTLKGAALHRPARRVHRTPTPGIPPGPPTATCIRRGPTATSTASSSSSGGKNATTGYAKIIGDDPLKLQVVDQGVYKSRSVALTQAAIRAAAWSTTASGTTARIACIRPAAYAHAGMNYNWPWLGPFVGFRYSTDFGKTWTQTPCTPAKPLFGENGLQGEPVKIGSPHFVDFGKNMEHSPDGKAYLVAHGATRRRQAPLRLRQLDHRRRDLPAPRHAGHREHQRRLEVRVLRRHATPRQAVWTSDFGKIKPIAAWNDNMGCVTMTYDAPLKKYLMCVTDGGNTVGYFNTYILESDRITGPWKLVAYLRHFGEQAYFVNIPVEVHRRRRPHVWLCYAANFSNGWNGVSFARCPPGSRYGMCLQEVAAPHLAVGRLDVAGQSAGASISGEACIRGS